MKGFKRFFCVFIAFLLVFLQGCKKNENENAVPALNSIDDESVYKNLGEDTLWLTAWGFDTFNPIATASRAVADCSRLVYDSLFYLDENLCAQGVLAKQYTVSDDKKTYTITLDTSFKFHDGTSFSAADAVYTINEIKRLNQKSLFFENVSNIESVSAGGSDILIIKIISPEPLFINNLSFPIVKNQTPSDTKVEFPIGTGPYKFVKTTLVRAMYFEENENYAGKRPTENKMKNAVVTFVPDKETQTYALEAHQADAACVTAAELANYNPKGAVKTIYYNNRRLTFIGINASNAALSNDALRRAVSYAIDRNDIINSVLFGIGEPTLLPFSTQGFMYPQKYKDVSKHASEAESALKDAGWTADTDSVMYYVGADKKKVRAEVSLLVNSENEARVQIAGKIAESLKQAGIKVNVVSANFETYKSRIESQKYDMYIGEVYMDSSYSTDLLFGANAKYSVYTSDELESAAAKKKSAVGREQTTAVFEQLSDCLAEKMPVVCLYFGCDALIANNMLGCGEKTVLGNEFANLRMWTKNVK